MIAPAERFREALLGWLEPGSIYTFVGAGGKSTAIKRAADLLVQAGMRVRITTTTRVGIEEFDGFPARVTRTGDELKHAAREESALLLVTAGETDDHLKYRGLDPLLLDRLPIPEDTVVLVEGDGSRRLPMKVPREHEPVIPGRSSAVFALMGARAFGEPIDERSCYNHEKALMLVGDATSFTAAAVAALASHSEGCRKGVPRDARFRILVNQGDLDERAGTARSALALMKSADGVEGALLSFEKGELYDRTD